MNRQDLPLPLKRGEISPELLITWYAELLDHMVYPADVRPYIENYDEWDIQNLIVWGENMMPSDWPHDKDIDAAPNCEEIYHTLKRISHVLRTRVCHWSGWKPEPITEVAWNAQQYAALKKGYHPDMDMRFATYHERCNFYIYRSGYILKKFHVKRGTDGLWHITKQYTTAKECTEHLVSDVLNYGYWEVPLGILT